MTKCSGDDRHDMDDVYYAEVTGQLGGDFKLITPYFVQLLQRNCGVKSWEWRDGGRRDGGTELGHFYILDSSGHVHMLKPQCIHDAECLKTNLEITRNFCEAK